MFMATQASELRAEKAWLRSIRRGNENVAKIHFYYHETSDGPSPTVYEVARASITCTSPTLFGQIRVLDNPLTADPDINSEQVGKAQGVITSADLENPALEMNINFVFTSGEYNGSTISIQGRNPYTEAVREFPVIGGTGVFRFASGYAITSTYSHDVEPDHLVIEYTLYVTYPDDSSTIQDLFS